MTSEGRTPIDAAREAESVTLLSTADRERAATALSAAFYDDPLMRWVVPDDSRRKERLRRGFAFWGNRIWWGHELSFTTQGVVGAAIWVPPDEWHLSVPAQLRLLPGMALALGRDLPRLLRALSTMEKVHPQARHYYLPVVGVEPSWQGKGLGTALLRPMLERCDRERMPAYLEATSERNRACYERNDFEVTGEITVADGPTLWAMWREAPTAGRRESAEQLESEQT
jgi:GNAT superfamily N-acetyltransferase